MAAVTPHYRTLAAELRQAITAGEYPPGSTLPTVADLVTQTGHGKGTITAALALLKDAGLVEGIPGTGMVVADLRTVQVPLSRYAAVMQPGGTLGPWETACQRQGVPGRMIVLEVEHVTADHDVTAALELNGIQRVVRRSRHAVLGDPERVVQIHTAWYPARLVRGTPIADETKVEGGIYGALIAAGMPPATADETVGGRPATDDEAAELRVRGGVLTLERITRDATRRPLEYLRVVANPARVRFVYDSLPLMP